MHNLVVLPCRLSFRRSYKATPCISAIPKAGAKNMPGRAPKKGNEEGIKPVGERQMMCHVAMEGTAAAGALIITNIIIIIS